MSRKTLTSANPFDTRPADSRWADMDTMLSEIYGGTVRRRISAAVAAAERSNSIHSAPWNQAPAWVTGTNYGGGSVVSSNGNLYACATYQVTPGTSGATPPSGTSAIPVSDGTLLWQYLETVQTAALAFDAPTVTMTTLPGGLTKNYPTVSGGVVQPTFNYVGGTIAINGTGVQMNASFNGSANVCQYNRLGFSTDAPQVFINLASGVLPYIPYSIEVDGRFTSPGPIVPGVSAGTNGILLDWTGSSSIGRKVRNITVHMPQRGNVKPLLGVNVDPLSKVWPIQNANRYRVCVEGDSLSAGAGPQDTKNLYPLGNVSGRWTVTDTFAALIGCDDIVDGAVTSTGFINNNSGTLNTYIQRLPFLVAQTPDVLVVFGNHNDTAYTSPARRAAITTYLQAARAALPNALIVLFGPWPEIQSSAATMQACDADMRAAVSAFNDSYVLFYSVMSDSTSSDGSVSVTRSWVTGTGWAAAGHQNSSGNSDIYVGPDNLHPTVGAAYYMGARYANAFKQLIDSLAS